MRYVYQSTATTVFKDSYLHDIGYIHGQKEWTPRRYHCSGDLFVNVRRTGLFPYVVEIDLWNGVHLFQLVLRLMTLMDR